MPDIQDLATALSEHIEARSKARMPAPVKLVVVDASNQTTGGWSWCTLNDMTVRCFTPSTIDATATGTILLALPTGDGDYVAIGVAWNAADNSPRIPRTVTSTVSGGHEAGKNLTLNSTTHATKGSIIINDSLTTSSGRVANVTRVTTTYTVLVSDHVVFCNTDGGVYTVTLPAGIDGQTFKIINSGSSSNNLTLAPAGSEHLIGVNSNFTLLDGESLIITFQSDDGWY